ncbi:MAG: porin [Bacteroidetes bacterium]|nr:MAG: porin [Bacteroidota bacterium]
MINIRSFKYCNIVILLFPILLSQLTAGAQSKDTTKQQQLPNGTDGLVFQKRSTDSTFVDKKTDLEPNEFEGTYSTFRIGMGYIGDYTAYSEDKVFKQQMDSAGLNLTPHYKTRDFRILASGRFLKTKRYIAWKFAYMYDGDKNTWLVRESGLTIGVPELKGHIFIGRTKEGYSMIKVMNGHSGLTNERQMALDPIPILADGIKYFGYLPKSGLFWNLGAYSDLTSHGQSFSTFEWQYVGRIGWLPINNTKTGTTLHIAANLRYGKPLGGKFTIKSRPESNPTPQLINTGEFAADKSSSLGGELYFKTDRFMIGSEMMVHNFYANAANDHHFFGGDAVISYFFTNTSRPYNTVGSVFGFVPVKKSVFKGGWGAIEGIIHVSTFNLSDKEIQGGQFTRITPMVNWYLTKFLRWELVYGYGILDRFHLKGNVQFFETRIQVTLM